MNEALELIRTRRSIRKFRPDPIPKQILQQIVEAGTYAPTGRNFQNPVILVVTNRTLRDSIMRANCAIGGWQPDFDPFYGAPVLLLVAVKNWENAVYDGSCVMMNLMQAAWALGVGSCWIHRAKEELESEFGKELLRKAGIQGDYIGVGHVALGYIDGEVPPAKPRKENWVYWLD